MSKRVQTRHYTRVRGGAGGASAYPYGDARHGQPLCVYVGREIGFVRTYRKVPCFRSLGASRGSSCLGHTVKRAVKRDSSSTRRTCSTSSRILGHSLCTCRHVGTRPSILNEIKPVTRWHDDSKKNSISTAPTTRRTVPPTLARRTEGRRKVRRRQALATPERDQPHAKR